MPTRRDMLMTAFSTSLGQESFRQQFSMITLASRLRRPGNCISATPISAVIGHGGPEIGGNSGCGSRISTRPAAGPSSSTASPRICAGLASTGTSRCWSSHSAPLPMRSAGALKARGLVYACFCTRADIAQSLTAPHGDAATSYPGHLPRPARRSGAAGHDAALLAARFSQGARRRRPAVVDRRRRNASMRDGTTSATQFSPARTHPLPIISPAWSTMPRAV